MKPRRCGKCGNNLKYLGFEANVYQYICLNCGMNVSFILHSQSIIDTSGFRNRHLPLIRKDIQPLKIIRPSQHEAEKAIKIPL
jgi:hypothetical protein